MDAKNSETKAVDQNEKKCTGSEQSSLAIHKVDLYRQSGSL